MRRRSTERPRSSSSTSHPKHGGIIVNEFGRLRETATTRGCAIAAAVSIIIAVTPAYGNSTGTLTLDTLSFISFQENETLLLPAGSTLQFTFSTPNEQGNIPFTISPSGVSIDDVAIPGSGRDLEYGLASPASGVLRPTSSGYIIEFVGTVSASFSDKPGTTLLYSINFTTETTTATDTLHSFSIDITGLRLIDEVWYAQIVGAATNHENAFPEPGAAVYTVLSGTFDHLPIGQ